MEEEINMAKKAVALVLALMLVLSLMCTSALAARPTSTLKRVSSSYAYRGGSITFYFRLNSGSYSKKSGNWRAHFEQNVYYKARKDANWVGGKAINFTGKMNYNFRWDIPYNMKTGKYLNYFGTYYKSGSYWYKGGFKTKAFRVR